MKDFTTKKGFGITYDNIYLVNGAKLRLKTIRNIGTISPDLGIYATKAALVKSRITGGDIDQVMYASIGQSSTDSYFSETCCLVFRYSRRIPS